MVNRRRRNDVLVLSRKTNETIKIGDNVEIRILEVKGDTIRIGIEAPKNIDILRGELVQSITETNTEALTLDASLFSQLTKKEQ
nr:carbon storage regulator CsrA [Sporosarcina luteola]